MIQSDGVLPVESKGSGIAIGIWVRGGGGGVGLGKQVRRGGRVGQSKKAIHKRKVFRDSVSNRMAQRVSAFVGMPLCNLRCCCCSAAAVGGGIKSRSTKPWSFIVFC